MTKKEKISILEGALKNFEPTSGLCNDVFKSGFMPPDWRYCCNGYDGYDVHKIEKFLSSVGIKKPKNAGLYWYPKNEKGHKKRISLLKAALKRLQK